MILCVYLSQQSTSAIERKHEKISIWSGQPSKSQSVDGLGCPTKTEIVQSFTIKSEVLKILTCIRQESAISETVSQLQYRERSSFNKYH